MTSPVHVREYFDELLVITINSFTCQLVWLEAMPAKKLQAGFKMQRKVFVAWMC